MGVWNGNETLKERKLSEVRRKRQYFKSFLTIPNGCIKIKFFLVFLEMMKSIVVDVLCLGFS